MLISCPKCRSIYEIPDDLIGKTGKNLRCQACNNVWHAMVEDTLGYQKNKSEKPFIEGIEVAEPPYRNYPSNKENFSVPLDNPDSNVKPSIPSSFDIVNKEGGVVDVSAMIKPKKNDELTLTSDKGTSFTISMNEKYNEDDSKQHFFEDSSDLKATNQDRISYKNKKKGYKLAYFMLFILFLSCALVFLRREIVAFYPEAEVYYNKIMLTGMDNAQYLKFQNVTIEEKNINNKNVIVIGAKIFNDSIYFTNTPDVAVKGHNELFKPVSTTLAGHDTTSVEVVIDAPKENENINLTLEFRKN